MSSALATAIPSVPSGALVQRPLVPFGPLWVPRAGAGQLENIGSIQNTGWEFTLGGQVIDTRQFAMDFVAPGGQVRPVNGHTGSSQTILSAGPSM